MFFFLQKKCKFARTIYPSAGMRLYGWIVVAIMVWGLSACSKDTSDVDDQRLSIESYLSRQGWTIDYLGGVYRYVLNRDRHGYEEAVQAESGDSVIFNYAVYQFSSSSTGGVGTLIYTNNPEIQSEQEGLDPTYWAKEPLGVELGRTPLISGLELGLTGVRQGDTLQLFMSSDKGYGDKAFGTIEANTPLVWNLGIKEVIK